MNRTIEITTGGSQHGIKVVQFALIGPTGSVRALFDLAEEDVLTIARVLTEERNFRSGRIARQARPPA